jgi:hypothetical protein
MAEAQEMESSMYIQNEREEDNNHFMNPIPLTDNHDQHFVQSSPIPGTSSFWQTTFQFGSFNGFTVPHQTVAPDLESGKKRKGCAVCRKAECARVTTCKGAGGQQFCPCGHPKLSSRERVRSFGGGGKRPRIS